MVLDPGVLEDRLRITHQLSVPVVAGFSSAEAHSGLLRTRGGRVFDLAESAAKLVSTYSGGMRRKLDLAMTLVTRPQIIFLDEPTTGRPVVSGGPGGAGPGAPRLL